MGQAGDLEFKLGADSLLLIVGKPARGLRHDRAPEPQFLVGQRHLPSGPKACENRLNARPNRFRVGLRQGLGRGAEEVGLRHGAIIS